MSTLDYKGSRFTIASFHAVPKKKNPEKEIKYFKYLPSLYPKLNIIFMGDFNCSQSNTVPNPLNNMVYKSILTNQKKSLRQKFLKQDCLASEYDNMFYFSKKLTVEKAEVANFYTQFVTLKEALKISDHIHIYGIVVIK